MVNPKILVVEDEIIVAKNIQNRLKNVGYTVPAIVSAGEEAVEKAAEIKPDLVLMDIKLEGKMTGIEAAEQIKKRFNIPVIYLTAYGAKKTLEHAKITEPYGYILKPVNINQLYSSIEMALYKHGIECKLKDNEKRLSTILTSIGDAIIVTDKKEHITFMNPVAEALTGWKQKDALGKHLKTVFNVINEKTRIPIKSSTTIVIQKDMTTHLKNHDALLISKDGRETSIDDSVASIKDFEGNIASCVLVFRDVTEQKKAEEELKKKIDELERFDKVTVDRELKMIELKKRIEELEGKLKETEK